ncbi:MAG: glutathione S-transferase family protein [Alphaproteobacteria bacterium]|nr:glutathione S-transferase family protein [Alphaproteobacteria bacterium]
MITLYQFPACWNVPNPSPYCMKVETYLRMADLPYRVSESTNPGAAPMGKLPYIVDGDRTVADSTFILEDLKARYGDSLNDGLGPAQRATAHALKCMIESTLISVLIYTRWLDDRYWPHTRDAFGAMMMSPVVARPVLALLRRRTARFMHRHGLTRHPVADIYKIGQWDLDALADTIGEQDFMMGATPTEIDATAFAMLANILWAPHDSPLQDHLKQRGNLVAYCERMKQRYYA